MSQQPSAFQPQGLATPLVLPSVSVLVPCYNSLPSVMRCLFSLTLTVDLGRTEILAQDDCSPDYSLLHVPLPPGVKPARNPHNLRFAGNVNEAARRAMGEYLFILNQDTRALPIDTDAPVVQQLLRPGWLDAMLALFLAVPDCGLVGPRLVFPNGAIQSVGGLFGGNKGPYHRYLGWSNPLDARVSRTEPVSWVTGAAMMIRRDDFWTLGGLDGATFEGGYFEDVDLAMKVRTVLGKRVYYCAEASLVHEPGSTGGNVHFRQNSVRFHQRWDAQIVPDSGFSYVDY